MCKRYEQVFPGRGSKNGEYTYRKMFNLPKKLKSEITSRHHSTPTRLNDSSKYWEGSRPLGTSVLLYVPMWN